MGGVSHSSFALACLIELTSIETKLHEAGWPKSLIFPSHWENHPLVTIAKPLSDAGTPLFTSESIRISDMYRRMAQNWT